MAAGRLDPAKVDERTIARHLDEPDMPDVDLFVRSSGEQRTSNFLLWQSAYAEMVFLDTLWPDFDRRDLWRAVELYASRDRRYGGAVPNAAAATTPSSRPQPAQPRAGPEHLDRVLDVDEPVLPRDPRPPSVSTARPSTSTVVPQLPADEVVVVAGRAGAVGRLAVVGAQDVDLAASARACSAR